MKMIDLFSGIGGFSLAAKWAGFETVQFVEKDKFCQKVLKKHWPNVPIHDDIKTFLYSQKQQINLLTAGFPCQPFSNAGKKRGKKDGRFLWNETFQTIRSSRPNWIIIENVIGFIPYLDEIIFDLESENYSCQSFIIAANLFGAPHKRERLWIIANINSKRRDLWINSFAGRSLQSYWQQYIEKIHQEWPQFISESWKTYEIENWFKHNSTNSRINDGISSKLDKNRIKALGNSIVPQVVYPIIKLIYEIENNNTFSNWQKLLTSSEEI